jgi:hypothetical protein
MNWFQRNFGHAGKEYRQNRRYERRLRKGKLGAMADEAMSKSNLYMSQAEDLIADNPYEVPDVISDAYRTSRGELADAQRDVDLARGAGSYGPLQAAMEQAADRRLSMELNLANRAATSSSDALLGAGSAYARNQAGMMDAAIAGIGEAKQERQFAENKKLNALQMMYSQAGQLGDYENLAYDLNVYQPYLQKMQFAQDLLGAGYNARIAKANNTAQMVSAAINMAGNLIPGLKFGAGGGQ